MRVATHIFSAKNTIILYIESAKTVNEMTLNELALNALNNWALDGGKLYRPLSNVIFI